jgi:hypothetical protein
MRGIMAARTKPIVVRQAIAASSFTYERDDVNEQNRKGILFQRENLTELIDIIKKEVRS